jgi:hypothetical protein
MIGIALVTLSARLEYEVEFSVFGVPSRSLPRLQHGNIRTSTWQTRRNRMSVITITISDCAISKFRQSHFEPNSPCTNPQINKGTTAMNQNTHTMPTAR